MQTLSNVSCKDGDLESNLAGLVAAIQEADQYDNLKTEQSAAEDARVQLTDRLEAQQSLEKVLQEIRTVDAPTDGAPLSPVCLDTAYACQ